MGTNKTEKNTAIGLIFLCVILVVMGAGIKGFSSYLTITFYKLGKEDIEATKYLGDMFILLGSNVGLMVANKVWDFVPSSWCGIIGTIILLVIVFFILIASMLFFRCIYIEILTLILIGLLGSALATEFEYRL